MRGHVSNDSREALLTVPVASPDADGRTAEVTAVIDTGFTGVGMGLLHGFVVTVAVVPNGPVTIRRQSETA